MPPGLFYGDINDSLAGVQMLRVSVKPTEEMSNVVITGINFWARKISEPAKGLNLLMGGCGGPAVGTYIDLTFHPNDTVTTKGTMTDENFVTTDLKFPLQITGDEPLTLTVWAKAIDGNYEWGGDIYWQSGTSGVVKIAESNLPLRVSSMENTDCYTVDSQNNWIACPQPVVG